MIQTMLVVSQILNALRPMPTVCPPATLTPLQLARKKISRLGCRFRDIGRQVLRVR